MKYLLLKDTTPRRLAFYLAMEEWVARSLPADDYFFIWRVNPTVIIGRNQDIFSEVDIDYCRTHGIDIVRRRSGGGCVYADLDNLMFSYITPADEVTGTFERYTSMVCQMLRTLGVDAAATGRNDILVNGRKVAGNAFYHLPERSIVHGTMLFGGIDAERMNHAITPSKSKLESKAVKSVSMRVSCLKDEGVTMMMDDFCTYVRRYLCKEDAITLSASNIAEIFEIEQKYYSDNYLYGRLKSHTRSVNTRIKGAGEFSVKIKLINDIINDIDITGDFFALNDPALLTEPLAGIKYNKEDLVKAIANINPEKIIQGLDKDSLLKILAP